MYEVHTRTHIHDTDMADTCNDSNVRSQIYRNTCTKVCIKIYKDYIEIYKGYIEIYKDYIEICKDYVRTDI